MWTTAGTFSCQAAARPRIPAFELCVCTTSGLSRRNAARSFRYALQVGRRAGSARTSSGITSTLSPGARRPVEEVPLGPFGRAGDQGHVVAVAMVQALDGQQGVLLGPADDQPRDDVDDPHGQTPRGGGFMARPSWPRPAAHPATAADELTLSPIADLHQEQPLRGRGRTRLDAVLGPQDLADPDSGRLPVPTSISVPAIARTILYRNPSASTSIETRCSLRVNIQVHHRPDAAGPVRPVGLEAAEVVPAQERLGRAVHRRDVEPVKDMPAIAELERAGDRAVVDHVAISLRLRVERRVERLGHLPRPRARGRRAAGVALRALTKTSGECREAVKKWTTCPSAWTPASVRPLAVVVGRDAGQPLDRLLEHLLDRPQPGCRCQPWKSVPS